MVFDEVFQKGYERTQELYGKEQEGFLATIAEARGMPVDWLDGTQAVFIPNNEFMMEVFGTGILEFDTYRNEICVWDNALVLPIRDVNRKAVAFAGFFPFDYVSDDCTNYYAYSSSSVFQKGRFLYFPKRNLEDAMDDGYLLLVDGIFDAISLSAHGYNAASLMGSSATPEILMMLRFVPNVILLADNDVAGSILFSRLKKRLNNIYLFTQGKAKDADGVLKSQYAAWFCSNLDKFIKRICYESRKQ